MNKNSAPCCDRINEIPLRVANSTEPLAVSTVYYGRI